MTPASENEMRSNYARAVGRRTEFLLKDFRAIDGEDHYQELLENGNKKLILRYLLAPKEFVVEDGHVKSMIFSPQKLEGSMNEQKALNDDSLPLVTIKTDAVIKSIGYKTMPISGVPFDHRKNTIPHEFGCVTKDGSPQIGLYVCGWAKRGPVGIIDATLRDSKETFGIIKHHIETDQLP